MQRRYVIVGLLAVLGAGCATKKPDSADEYKKVAEQAFREGAFSLAVENWRGLLDQYPFSDHAEEAELRIAQAHYLDGAMIEAIAALTDFERRHPTSPQLPLVGYYIGMAYKRQMGTTDRDQTAARSADAYFQALISQYPKSPYAELAREQLAECQKSMATHELAVADFYAKRGNTRASERRALEVVGRYPGNDVTGEALYRLGQLYQQQSDQYRAQLAYESIVQQYPASVHAPAASSALKELGADEGKSGSDPRNTLLAASGYTPTAQAPAEPVKVPGIDFESRPIPAGPAGIPGGGGFPGGGGSYGPSGPYGRGRSY